MADRCHANATDINTMASPLFILRNDRPATASDRCIDCNAESDCPFSAVDLYSRRGLCTDNFDPQPDETHRQTIDRYLRHSQVWPMRIHLRYRCPAVAEHQSHHRHRMPCHTDAGHDRRQRPTHHPHSINPRRDPRRRTHIDTSAVRQPTARHNAIHPDHTIREPITHSCPTSLPPYAIRPTA